MMKSLSFIFAVFSVNLILTNGEELKTELRNQTSDEFEEISKNVEAVMDPTVDPCGNFYKFVCGRFSEDSLSPYDHAFKQTKKLIISKYEQEEPLESEDKSSLIKHSRSLFKSCMNRKTVEPFDEFLLRDIEAIGGWPALKGNSWNKSAFDWKYPVFKAGNQVTWIDYLFSVRLVKDDGNILVMFNRKVDSYEDALQLAVRLGGNNSIVEAELEKVKEFINTFLKTQLSGIEIGSHRLKFTLQNLINKYPYYPWLEHFRYLLPDIQLNDTLDIVHFNTIEKVHSLLNNTDQRILANIIAQKRISDLNKNFESHYRLQKNPNNENCFELVSRVFPMAPTALYLREFAYDNKTNTTKQLAEIILNKIRQEFISMVQKSDWIGHKTYFTKKMEKISYQFGYPLDVFEDNLLNKYYDKLQYNQSNFYDTILSSLELIRIVQSDEKLVAHSRELQKSFTDYRNTSFAYYLEKFNSILVKFTLLQQQFLDINHPMWMNFASFGAIIGHEFGQSLVPIYIQTKAEETFTDGYEDSTDYGEYDRRIRCLNDIYREIGNITEYLEYDEEDLPTTRDEVADNLSFKAVHSAYKNSSVKENSRTLNQKEYSPDQLFWIYATNRFCSRWQPLNIISEQDLMYSVDPRNSNELRILASLSNSDGFARDFNCPKNSKMNRQPKCRIF